ncbi:tape measure protein [Pseudanabaena phage Pam4]|nr:tape measure protein [Pseudanabaena phage Pam4]
MSEVVGEAVIVIRPDESAVDTQALGKTAGTSYSQGFGSSIKRLAGVIGGVLAAREVLGFAKEGIASAREWNKEAAKTDAILKATGGVANVTADDVAKMAGELEAMTAVDDAVIAKGANLLLTFKNVRNEVGEGADIFDRANKAALDLSAAGFGSSTGAALQLGKALNDPLKGMTALARSGVTFTEAQKAQVEQLVASGDLLSAQKVILAEVESQVQGTAAAQVDGTDRAATAYDNLRQAVGAKLLPVVDRLAGLFADKVAPALFAALDATDQIGPAFSRVKDAVTGVLDTLAGAAGADSAGGLFASLRAAAEDVIPVVVGYVNDTLLPAVRGIADEVGPVLSTAADTFRTVLLPALLTVGEYVTTNVLPILSDLGNLIVTQVVPAFADVATFIYGTVYPAVLGIVAAVAENLLPVFDALVDTVRTQIVPTVADLVTKFREELLPVLEPIIEKVLSIVGALARFASAVLGTVLPPLIKFSGFIIAKVVPVLFSIVKIVLRVIDAVLGIPGAIGGAIRWFGRLTETIDRLIREGLEWLWEQLTSLPDRIANIGPRMLRAGKAMIGALLDGLGRVGGFAKSFAGQVWDAIKGAINAGIDRLNDLLEFTIPIKGLPDVTVNPPNIGRLATGTAYWRGGPAVVGEEGPETVYLPRGSAVANARDTAAMRSGPGVYIAQVVAHDYDDFVRQARQRERLAALGGRRPVAG